MPTVAQAVQQLPHRSFWFEALRRRAGGGDVRDWLIEEANLRGYFGAFVSEPTRSAPARDLSDEELIVALVSVHAELDARVLKLIVRILQSGHIDVVRLGWWARRERATHLLHWLLARIPEQEKEALQPFIAHFSRPPRGHREILYHYDPSRLLKRPARSGAPWRTPQR